MESPEPDYLKVGDAVPTVRLDNETGEYANTNATVLEIHPCPEDEKETRRLVGELVEKYQSLGQNDVTVILGENLADNLRVTNRVVRNSIYVLEI